MTTTPRMDAAGEYVHLVTTANRADTRQFGDVIDAAVESWQSAGSRPDGKPNRQPTAYTGSLEAW